MKNFKLFGLFVFGLTISQLSAKQTSEYHKADLDKIENAYKRTTQDIKEAAQKITLAVVANLVAELEVTPDDQPITTVMSPCQKAVMQYLDRTQEELNEKLEGVQKACFLVDDKGKDGNKPCDQAIAFFYDAMHHINGGLYLK
jgi:hypothetical protein